MNFPIQSSSVSTSDYYFRAALVVHFCDIVIRIYAWYFGILSWINIFLFVRYIENIWCYEFHEQRWGKTLPETDEYETISFASENKFHKMDPKGYISLFYMSYSSIKMNLCRNSFNVVNAFLSLIIVLCRRLNLRLRECFENLSSKTGLDSRILCFLCDEKLMRPRIG